MRFATQTCPRAQREEVTMQRVWGCLRSKVATCALRAVVPVVTVERPQMTKAARHCCEAA